MERIDNLNQTPRSSRLHIGIYGRRNSGKSSLVNAICTHKVSLVSDIAGTTTDPVYKSIELHGLGACVLIDTAGFDDVGKLGEMRVESTLEATKKTDIAILLFSAELNPSDSFEKEIQWLKILKKQNTPVLVVINKADIVEDTEQLKNAVKNITKLEPLVISANDPQIQGIIRFALIRLLPENYQSMSITGRLVKEGNVVLLVMPQDIQAPEGRLILPQVQTIRDLLDNRATVVCTTTDKLDCSLNSLKKPPELIITDSQAFSYVYEHKPEESKLTSFSILLSAIKGDINVMIESAKALDTLPSNAHILMAEACTHAPLENDIGRIKIPNLLRKKYGNGLVFDTVTGTDYPENLEEYDLIIHCGACMFNRKYVLNRLELAQKANVPMTNYGVVLAKLGGILDKIVY